MRHFHALAHIDVAAIHRTQSVPQFSSTPVASGSQQTILPPAPGQPGYTEYAAAVQYYMRLHAQGAALPQNASSAVSPAGSPHLTSAQPMVYVPASSLSRQGSVSGAPSVVVGLAAAQNFQPATASECIRAYTHVCTVWRRSCVIESSGYSTTSTSVCDSTLQHIIEHACPDTFRIPKLRAPHIF